MSEVRRGHEEMQEKPKDRPAKPKSRKLATIALSTAMTVGSMVGMESEAHAAEPVAAAVKAEKAKKTPEKKKQKTQAEVDQEAKDQAMGRLKSATPETVKDAAAARIDDARKAAQDIAEQKAAKVKSDIEKKLGLDEASKKAAARAQEKRNRKPKKPSGTVSAFQKGVNWFFGIKTEEGSKEKPAK